ncbi:MAG: hypothetical protein R3C10_14430 [Pirellulales bacterium]
MFFGDTLPQYEATVDVTLTVGRREVGRRYLIDVTPIETNVAELYVHFSSPSTESLEWQVESSSGVVGAADSAAAGDVSARRLTAAQQAAIGLGPFGETWDVHLPRASTEPFRLRARGSEPFATANDVALAMVNGAARQTGVLNVEALPDCGVRIETERLRATPVGTAAGERPSLLRGRYQFLPLRDARGDGEPAVVLHRDADFARHPSLVVWDCAYSSHADGSGVALHRVEYRMENFGADNFTVQLDTADRLRRVEVNQFEVAPRSAGTEYTIPLPKDKRFSLVTLEVETQRPTWGWWGHVEVPHVDCEAEVLNRRRVVWLPSAYRLFDVAAVRAAPTSGAHWWARLFGTLADSANQLRSGRPALGALAATDQVTGVPRIDEWIEALGAAYRELVLRTGAPPTWGELLAGADRHHYASPTNRLLVDAAALDAVGLHPDAAAAAIAGDSDSAVGGQLLQASHLLVVREQGWNVLTTGAALNRRTASGSAAADVVGGQLGDDPATGQLTTTAEVPWYLVGVEAWVLQSMPPWHEIDPTPSAEPAGDGWQAVTIATGQVETPLAVVDRRVWVALTAAVFLFAIAVGLSARGIDGWWLVAAALVAAGAALLAPLAVAGFFTAALGGFVAALLGRGLLATRLPPEQATRSNLTISPRSLGTVVAVLLLSLSWTIWPTDWSLGQGVVGTERGSDGIEHGGTVYRVYIPTDDGGTTAAGRYYVPTRLYDELRRRAAATRLEPSGWLIEKAEYQGGLEAGESLGELRLQSLKASYYINVFGPDTTLTFPLPRGHTGVRVASVSVDGTSVAARDAQGHAVFSVDTLGRHVVDVGFVPDGDMKQGADAFQIGVPSVGQATLVVLAPPNTQSVRVASPASRLLRDESRGRLAFSIGAAEEVDVRWGKRSLDEAEMVVNELLWLDVRRVALKWLPSTNRSLALDRVTGNFTSATVRGCGLCRSMRTWRRRRRRPLTERPMNSRCERVPRIRDAITLCSANSMPRGSAGCAYHDSSLYGRKSTGVGWPFRLIRRCRSLSATTSTRWASTTLSATGARQHGDQTSWCDVRRTIARSA